MIQRTTRTQQTKATLLKKRTQLTSPLGGVASLVCSLCAPSCSGPGFAAGDSEAVSDGDRPTTDLPAVELEVEADTAPAGRNPVQTAPAPPAPAAGTPAATPAPQAEAPVASAAQPTPPTPMTPAEQFVAHLPLIEAAALGFIQTVDPAMGQLVFDFDDERRTNFSRLSGEREGLALEDLNTSQLEAFNQLLQTILSDRGFEQVWNVMTLQGDPNEVDDLPFYVAFFGSPGDGRWMVCLEGRHLSANFTFVGTRFSATPLFLGADPAVVESGPRAGTSTLGLESDAGLNLFQSLTNELRRSAWISREAPGDLQVDEASWAEPLDETDATAADMSEPAIHALRQLIEAYIGDLHPVLTAAKQAELDAVGLDDFSFAWMGPTETQETQYFRLQGPDSVIELGLKEENHLRTVWREFNGDYGRSLY